MTFPDIRYTSKIQTEREQVDEQVNIGRVKMRLIGRQKWESYITLFNGVKEN